MRGHERHLSNGNCGGFRDGEMMGVKKNERLMIGMAPKMTKLHKGIIKVSHVLYSH